MILFFISHTTFSQILLNGSFEYNPFNDCFNLYTYNCQEFTDSVPYTNCISNAPIVDLPFFNSDCSYADGQPFSQTPVPDGKYFIGLNAGIPYDGDLYFEDAISLEITEALTIGTEYKLHFYKRAEEECETFCHEWHQPIKFKIGISTNANEFGTEIYTSDYAYDPINWEEDEVVFTPNIEATYITLKAIPEEGNGGVFVDHFQLQNTLSIDDFNPNTKFELYPNPTNSILSIHSIEKGIIEIFTIQGEKLFNVNKLDYSTHIDMSKYNSGIYLIKLNNTSRYLIKE